MNMIKSIPAVLCAAFMIFSSTSCGSEADGAAVGKSTAPKSTATQSIAAKRTDKTDTSGEESMEQTISSDKGGKVLVAYFSCTGNTKKLAGYAAEITGGTLYEIVPAEAYTAEDRNYNDSNSRTSKEMNDKDCRPAISGKVDNFENYDTVFLAYPIWWGDAPRIISTFVESYDFSGKTVVPFCTSGSSGIGSSAKDLQALTSGAKWLDGTRHSSSMSKDEMAAWIAGLGLGL